MADSFFILTYLSLITILQSTIGIGILVLGTPFLLILDYNIVEIFYILLPISIVVSFSNLIIMKFINKNSESSALADLKKFFIICVPSILVGLVILKFFQKFINFNILVGAVIILSIFLLLIKDKITYKIFFFRKSILSIVGVVHGLTNSGGTIMSLALSTNNKKNYARYNITFFYLLLAIFHYLMILLIFSKNFIFPYNLNLIFLVFISIIMGNLLIKYINEKIYKLIVNLLAVLTSIILLTSS